MKTFTHTHPWWKFWTKPEQLVDSGQELHSDWKQLAVPWHSSNDVQEAWFNFELMAWACQNRHTGKWHYFVGIGSRPDLDKGVPTRRWAQIAAEDLHHD